jgi:hypothetical protein
VKRCSEERGEKSGVTGERSQEGEQRVKEVRGFWKVTELCERRRDSMR